MVLVIDRDDPAFHEYEELQAMPELLAGRVKIWHGPHTPGMVGALNAAAAEFAPHFRYLGFVGDDNRFRTPGWDKRIVHELDAVNGGMGFCNDYIRNDIPTHIFMSSSIPQTLGWMALPTCTHLYIDNAWRAIGDAIDRLFYFEDIVIEHLHPMWGKGQWDEGYRRVNDQRLYDRDHAAFQEWWATRAPADIAKLKALFG